MSNTEKEYAEMNSADTTDLTPAEPVYMQKPPHPAKVAIKAFFAAALAFVIFAFAFYTIASVSTDMWSVNETDMIGWCESDYIERDMAALYENLTLFDLYGERFGLYWEAVNGYELYVEAVQWSRAVKLGIEGAAEKAAEHLSALRTLADAPAYERNASLLAHFLKEAETAE